MGFDRIKEAIIEHWGERCEDFDENCPCCLAWAELDALLAPQTTIDKPISATDAAYVVMGDWKFNK